MRQLIRRVWYAIRQRQFEADLTEELEFHRAMKQRELENPERIMSLNARDGAGRQLGASYLDFQDWRTATKAFSGIAAFSQATISLSDNGRAPERASVSYVSANTFRLLGEKPALGRDFLPEDD